jgi:hypothetical protein
MWDVLLFSEFGSGECSSSFIRNKIFYLISKETVVKE